MMEREAFATAVNDGWLSPTVAAELRTILRNAVWIREHPRPCTGPLCSISHCSCTEDQINLCIDQALELLGD